MRERKLQTYGGGDESRQFSRGGAGGELASARWEQGASVVGEERPQGWGTSPPRSPGGPLQLGSFCRVAMGRAGKKCPMYSRSQPMTEIPTPPLPEWL